MMIIKFFKWLYSDDETADNTVKAKPATEKTNIDKALSTLKRSGLALPYEVWPEYVVHVVHKFDKRFPDKTAQLLNSAVYAVRVRRNYILPPNTPSEEVIHREIVWVYGVFVALVLHYAEMSILQMSQLFGENPQLAITSDKALCETIEAAVKDLESDNVIAEILGG